MKRIRFYWFFFRRFLSFYWRAGTIYDIHSPFAAAFIREVVEDSRSYYAFSRIEGLRRKLLQDQTPLTILDHGAGSRVSKSRVRKVSSIARFSAISPATGRLLFRAVNFFRPTTIIELGTSLGISTLYLAAPFSGATVITIEGCPNTASRAASNFSALDAGNIDLRIGPFSEQLPRALHQISQLDLLYIDGDHRFGASLNYFRRSLEKMHNGSVLILADIHWSREMENAWREMKDHHAVTLSIDLFQLGFLFFNRDIREKQHLRITLARWKPWRMGFFWRS